MERCKGIEDQGHEQDEGPVQGRRSSLPWKGTSLRSGRSRLWGLSMSASCAAPEVVRESLLGVKCSKELRTVVCVGIWCSSPGQQLTGWLNAHGCEFAYSSVE